MVLSYQGMPLPHWRSAKSIPHVSTLELQIELDRAGKAGLTAAALIEVGEWPVSYLGMPLSETSCQDCMSSEKLYALAEL
jgi:hypothetical protein